MAHQLYTSVLIVASAFVLLSFINHGSIWLPPPLPAQQVTAGGVVVTKKEPPFPSKGASVQQQQQQQHATPDESSALVLARSTVSTAASRSVSIANETSSRSGAVDAERSFTTAEEQEPSNEEPQPAPSDKDPDDRGPVGKVSPDPNHPSVERVDNNTSTNNNDTTLVAALPPPPPATIVAQLSGEMGNQLSKIAHAHALSLWLNRLAPNNNFPTRIVLRHGGREREGKWRAGRNDIQKCFVNTRSWDFSEGNCDEFNERTVEMRLSLGNDIQRLFVDGINTAHQIGDIEPILRNFSLLYINNLSSSNSSSSKITLPFLRSNKFVAIDLYMDTFYNDYRELFKVDPACCALLPEPDESVFHFRNFLQEMRKKGLKKGFQELPPNQTAHELFGHLGAGDKVAILTRFPDSPVAQRYVKALQARGLIVRVVAGQTSTQDFCFLQHAKKEVVGIAKSTYFIWAGILGNSTNVRAYSIDSKERRKLGRDVFSYYNWTHPELKAKFSFELYNVTEAYNASS